MITRNCNECNAVMDNGYIVDSGAEYYCSNKCLYKNYTPEQYDEMYKNDVAFYTTWEK